MSKLSLLSCCLVLAFAGWVESIYSFSITSIEGNNKPLSAYQNKKILIITLPTQQTVSNDSLLRSLDSLRNANSSSLVIIGVPSYEDGYTANLKNQLKQWYRTILGTGIIITEGLRTRKTSGPQQHALFKWLTDKDRNGHFDQDVAGPRYKFLVRANGELFGVLGPQNKIGGAAMIRMLQTQ